MRQAILTIMILMLQSPLALATSVNELRSEVDYKISVYQARGELTGRQIIAFKDRAQVISEQKKDVLQKQRDLANLSWQIDQARKPPHIANRSFTWW